MSGDLEGARRLFEQALRLDPECERARELLGTKPAAAEALPEELQNVPSSNTNLFAVPLPRLFPETASEAPEAPTDPFIPLSMVAPLSPSYGTGPPPAVRPLVAPPSAASVTPAWGTPRPGPAPRGPSMPGTPPPGPAPRAPASRGTPLPGPAPRGPSAGGTPLPGFAPRGPSGPGAPPPTAAPSASLAGWTLPAPPPSAARAGAAPVPLPEPAQRTPVVPLPEPAQRSVPVATAEHPSAVVSDDWWSDSVGTPASPKDAWEVGRPRPTTLSPSEATETDALHMVAPLPANAGGTPLPAKMPSDPVRAARMLLQRATELQELDDHSGARELLLEAQALDPEAPEVARALAESEQTLQALYESKLGKLSVVPRVRLRDDEVIWLNLDHRAGFILAQIDGSLSFDDLFSVSGMSRLDTARILVQLLEQRVLVR